jgi:acetaldehyde dehydrogenase
MKVKVAIIGSGNIGTDLMYKVKRSPVLEVGMVVGVEPASEGLALARKEGFKTTHEGISALLRDPDGIEIAFDATTAKAHKIHAPLLEKAGIIAIDLTPAAIGPYVIPPVNIKQHIGAKNINLTTCGGQATIPIVEAINRAGGVQYAEIVATIASKSAGPGTRQNIDEFTQTTARGLEKMGGAKKGKAIIILNPAEPPIMMRDTVYAIVENVDPEAITRSIHEMVKTVSAYVPGYRLRSEPIFDGNKVTVFIEVEGAGDYLPKYSGNLDIMTASAVKVAEEMARDILARRGSHPGEPEQLAAG